MTIKKLASAVGVLAVMLGSVLATAGPATATEDGYYPDAGWLVQDTTIGPDVDWSDCDPGPTRSDAALSAIVDATHVGLTGTGEAAPPHYGTSIETADLGMPVSAGDTISVDYALIEGASAAAGAVRLFIYSAPNADTDCTAPAAFVAAPDDGSTSGTLQITVAFDGHLGTVGMVYDSSNGGVGGTVRFSDLKVGYTPVHFTAPPVEPTEEPEPTTEPSASPTPDADVVGGGELPRTGPSWLLPAVGGALIAIATGVAILFALRRSRQPRHFTTG